MPSLTVCSRGHLDRDQVLAASPTAQTNVHNLSLLSALLLIGLDITRLFTEDGMEVYTMFVSDVISV